MSLLSRIRVVLVGTQHPGNIGSAARAMKTMGLRNLVLVAPEVFPDPRADALAVGAVDLLEQARVCASHLAGFGHLRYTGSVVSTSLKVTGIELFSGGNFAGGEGCEVLILRDPEAGVYKRVVLKDNRVVGALLYGEARDGAWYLELMQQRRDISGLRDRLLFGRAYADVAEAA